MSRHSDQDVIAALESMGTPWEQHFVLNGSLIAFESESGQLFSHIIEDDDLNESARKFLIREGKVR